MKHLGDITKINGYEIPVPDVIIGGSPCQDLSVAGKRAGLDGERSGLFMEQIRVTKELREHDRRDGRTDILVRPRWFVWENVPGALSSGTPKGEDFRIVLEEICKIIDENAVIPGPPNGKWNNAGCIVGNGYSVAWRILDGQYWGCTYFNDEGIPVKLGTPQRRRRIALVADLNGECAGEILFERKSVSGDFEQGIEERKGAAGNPEEGVGSTNCLNPWDVQSKHIQAKDGKAESLYSGECRYGGGESYVMDDTPSAYTLKIRGGREIDSLGKRAGKGALVQTELSGTLSVSQDQTLIQAFGISAQDSNSMKSSNPHSGIYKAETTRTLDLNGGNPSCNQGGMAVVALEGNGTRESHRGDGYAESDVSFTLNSTEYHGVAYGVNIGGVVRHNAHPVEETSVTLTSQAKSGDTQASVICVDQGAGKSSVDTLHDKSPTLATTHDGAPVIACGCDVYNQTLTGDVAATVSAYSCMTSTRNGPSVVVGTDIYNQSVTGDVSMTISSRATDPHHIPTVITDGNVCTR